jgi:hypothetical protein
MIHFTTQQLAINLIIKRGNDPGTEMLVFPPSSALNFAIRYSIVRRLFELANQTHVRAVDAVAR